MASMADYGLHLLSYYIVAKYLRLNERPVLSSATYIGWIILYYIIIVIS